MAAETIKRVTASGTGVSSSCWSRAISSTILDVTDCPGVEKGDEVIFIGKSGDHEICASTLARVIDTIGYEIACGISPRVPRVFV